MPNTSASMLLHLHVTTHAKRNHIAKIDDTHFKVWVTVPAENGRANVKVIALLSEHLDVAKSSLHIIGGVRSREKTVEVY